MSRGFLGYDASLMLDVVVCALALIGPALVYSIHRVKVRRDYALHRTLQIAIGAALLIAVSAFEIDMQVYHGGWENVVNRPGEPIRRGAAELASARRVLRVHLVFAITTPVLWAVTLWLALRRFSKPPAPGPHSGLHKTLGWLATFDMALTSLTGLAFYYFAFVA